LAKKADVGTGTIYHHFKDKEALIQALYAEMKIRMGQVLEKSDKPILRYRKRFDCIWEGLYVHYIQHPSEFMFLEQYSNSPYIRKSDRENNMVHYQYIIAFLDWGMKTGHLRKMNMQLMLNLLFGNISTLVRLFMSGEMMIDMSTLKIAIQSSWDSICRPQRQL
jgi:AcrR family transcriptional regulator